MSELNNNTNFKAPKRLELLMSTTYPPIEWLVDKMIPTESVVIMSAPASSLKTWLMSEISIKVASGEALFGRFTTTKTGVLILDEESGERQLHRNFTVLNADPKLPIYCVSYAGRLLDDEYVEWLIDFCQQRNIGLIAFDSLTRFHDANENDAGEMAKVFKLFSKFKNAGITCLIIHHHRKANGRSKTAEAMRGSSDILAACDVHFALDRQGNNISVEQTKNRLDVESAPFTARFIKRGKYSDWQFLGYDDTQEDTEDRLKNSIVQFITDNPGKNQKQILEGLNTGDEKVIGEKKLPQLLKVLVMDGFIYWIHGDRTEKLYFVCDDSDDEGERQNG